MPSVPREKYPEMNWRAADKVAAWKTFKRRMNVIFMADQIPEERQWALILVAGGDEAYNPWDTLEDTVEDCKKVDQVWNAFKKSFEQSTSFWHFRDTYLADLRQAPRMGRPAIDAKASVISKLFVIPRLQPRRRRALTEARSHSRRDMVPQGATVARAKEVATVNTRRRRCQRSH